MTSRPPLHVHRAAHPEARLACVTFAFIISFMCVCLCVCVSRSDSDSEGENPEKKKLQEQLMGEICLQSDMSSYHLHGA